MVAVRHFDWSCPYRSCLGRPPGVVGGVWKVPSTLHSSTPALLFLFHVAE